MAARQRRAVGIFMGLDVWDSGFDNREFLKSFKATESYPWF
jgi:hypothetical protein